MDQSILFLLGQAPDHLGRTVQQYLHFDDAEWEFQHDVIQTAFPTRTQSKFHPSTPFLPVTFDISSLSADDAQRCKATISLLLRSYMQSIGVEFLINQTLVTFTLKSQYPAWADSHDHNTLRLSRVLETLGIFDMGHVQTALYDFLVYEVAATNTRIIGRTVAFWSAARDNKQSLILGE